MKSKQLLKPLRYFIKHYICYIRGHYKAKHKAGHGQKSPAKFRLNRQRWGQTKKGLIQARDWKQGAVSLQGKCSLVREQEDPYQEAKNN